ncbi:hypothetical protein [Paraburkholderia sp. UYCP14C]|nr:hypothetical protein [Paraburkholderia sp. UYCP14C]
MSSLTTEQPVASQQAGVVASTLNQAVARALKRLHSVADRFDDLAV